MNTRIKNMRIGLKIAFRESTGRWPISLRQAKDYFGPEVSRDEFRERYGNVYQELTEEEKPAMEGR